MRRARRARQLKLDPTKAAEVDVPRTRGGYQAPADLKLSRSDLYVDTERHDLYDAESDGSKRIGGTRNDLPVSLHSQVLIPVFFICFFSLRERSFDKTDLMLERFYPQAPPPYVPRRDQDSRHGSFKSQPYPFDKSNSNPFAYSLEKPPMDDFESESEYESAGQIARQERFQPVSVFTGRIYGPIYISSSAPSTDAHQQRRSSPRDPPFLLQSQKSKSQPVSKFATALYDFEGREAGDLAFQRGDIIEVSGSVNDDWYIGKCKGVEGFVPGE